MAGFGSCALAMSVQWSVWFRRYFSLLHCAFLASMLCAPGYANSQAKMDIPGSFSVSPSGAATYTSPIQVPPGTMGMQPGLALSYSSQAGNGLLGVGWSLGGFSAITRCAKTLAQDSVKTAITLTNNDAFCWDGQRLMAISGAYGAAGTEYRTELESFARIISYGAQGAGPFSFIVETKSGHIMHYSPIVSSGQTTAHIWALYLVRDKLSNCMSVAYSQGASGQELYPTNVYYSGRYNAGTAGCDGTYNRIDIAYEGRSDISDGYFGPAKTKQSQRISRVDTFSPAGMAKRYAFSYGLAPATSRSRLVSVTEFAGDGITALPATTFTYHNGGGGIAVGDNRSVISGTTAANWRQNYTIIPGDFNGDGVSDLYLVGSSAMFFCPGLGITSANNCIQTIVGNFRTNSQVLVGDFNADGVSDLYLKGGTSAYFCSGRSISPGTLANCTQTATSSLFNSSDNSKRLVAGDFNGDGYFDLVFAETSLNGTISLVTKVTTCNGPGVTSAVVFSTCPSQTYSIPQVQQPGSSGSGPADARVIVGDFDGNRVDDTIVGVKGGASSFPNGYLASGSYFCRGAAGCSLLPSSALGGGGYFAGSVTHSRSGDFNGDGYIDLIMAWRFCPGPILSPGATCVTIPQLSPAQSDIDGTRLKMTIGDFNGDGKTDLFINDDPFAGAAKTMVCLAPGFLTANNCVSITPTENWISSLITPYPGDFNGDGVTDIITVSDANVKFGAGGNGEPDRLLTATSGLRVTTSVTYKTLTDSSVYAKDNFSTYPIIDVQAPMNVIASLTTSNGIGGTLTSNYRYGGLKVDIRGRGSLGFRWTTATRPADASTAQYTDTRYQQLYPYIGLVTNQDSYVNNGGVWRLVRSMVNTLSNTGQLASPLQAASTRYFPYVSQTLDRAYDYGTGGLLASTQTDYQYTDGWGNPTSISVITNDGYTASTTNTYSNNVATWVIGRITGSSATRTSPGGASQTKTSSFTPNTTTGLLTQEIIEPNAPALKVITDNGYDTYGNKTSVTVRTDIASTDPAYFAPRTSRTYFDTSAGCVAPPNYIAGRFPVRSTNAVGQAECYDHDSRFGGQTKLTGPNGISTQWTYDSFGRKSRETRADGSTTDWTYFDNSLVTYPNLAYGITTSPSTGTWSIVYFDQLNRPIENIVARFESLSGSYVNETEYDGFGRVARQYKNRLYDAAVKPFTSFTYDPLGRVLSSTAPNGLITNFGYSGLTTTVTVNNSGGSQTTSKTINSQGWITNTVDAAGGITSFTYDPNGNLLTTTDPKLNNVTMTYDLKGRKTGMNDPDMGAWIYSYDALGQLKSQRDAKLQTTTMTYDVLGRMTKRSEPSLISDFYFDKYADNSACSKGIGKLCEVKSSNDYRRKHYYDTLGRANRTDYYHDSISSFYQVDNTFDSQGRIDTVTYPAVTIGTTTTRLTIKNNYNPAGYLFKITNAAGTLAYWTATAMDADGHVTSEILGNGLSTTRTYQAATARLTGISTGAGGAAQNLTYAYDTIGNLTTRTDTFTTPSPATINETFTYDALNRLKTVAMTGTTTLSKSYNYDQIGNIIYKSDLGGTGVLTYPASGASSVRPHAVSNVNGTIGGVVNPNYTYDANGNLLTSLAGTRMFTYSSFNMPTRIDRGTTSTSWIYDADHNRTQELTNTPVTGKRVARPPRIL
jgi:YD repeat-containing protein